MQSTHELHERYVQALHAQRAGYVPQKAMQRLWLSMLLMMLGLLALFWLLFIEPLSAKKGLVTDLTNRALNPAKNGENEQVPDEPQPPTSEKPEGPSGHSLGPLSDDLTDRLN